MQAGWDLLSGTFSQSWVHLGELVPAQILLLVHKDILKAFSNGCLLHSTHKMWNVHLSRSPQVEVKPGTTLAKLTHVLLASAPFNGRLQSPPNFAGESLMCLEMSHSLPKGVCWVLSLLLFLSCWHLLPTSRGSALYYFRLCWSSLQECKCPYPMCNIPDIGAISWHPR